MYFDTLPVNDNGINNVSTNMNKDTNKNIMEYPHANNHTTNNLNGFINCNEFTDHSTVRGGNDESGS